MILTCIAVDDEPLALNLLVSYIEKIPYLRLKGSFSNAVDALAMLHQEPVQLAFLDIRMNDLSGLELARVLDQYRNTVNLRVIFATAYDQYALESYKVEALDYLLKPFSFIDFSKAVEKAVRYYEHVKGPAADYNKKEDLRLFLYLKVEYQTVRVLFDDILYLESDKDYVKVYLRGVADPLTSLISMKAIEEKLPMQRFMRVHRSFIVSLDNIRAATKGSVEVSGRSIPVSEQYRDIYTRFFKKWQ